MSKSKRKQKEIDPVQAQAKLEEKAAKVRAKFEKKESKLQRQIFKHELAVWDAEIDLLEYYAEYASEEKRQAYEQEIAQWRAQLAQAHAQVKQLKKHKKFKAESVSSEVGQIWQETTQAFAEVSDKVEQARPQFEPVLPAEPTEQS